MAEMIQVAHSSTGATLYALLRNSDGEVWDTVLGGFVPYATVDLANYVIPLIEQGTASQFYTADSPGPFGGLGVMVARAAVYEQLGGSPAEGDTPIAVVDLSLSAFQSIETIVSNLTGHVTGTSDAFQATLQKWLRVLFRSDAAIAIDGVDDLADINADQGSGPGTYDNTTDSVQAIADAGGGSGDWTADEKTAIRSILGVPGAGTTPDDPTVGILDTIRDSVGTRSSQTSVDDLPTNAELATALAAADDAVLAAVATRSSQTSVDDLPTNAELATSQAAADDATLSAIATLNNLSSAQAQTAAAAALTAYDPPTEAEMNARTMAAAAITKLTAHTAAVTMVVIGTGSTTISIVLDPATGVDGGAPPAGADVFNRRVLVLTSGALNRQALTISDYDGSTGTLTMAAPGFTGSAAAGVIGVVV